MSQATVFDLCQLIFFFKNVGIYESTLVLSIRFPLVPNFTQLSANQIVAWTRGNTSIM